MGILALSTHSFGQLSHFDPYGVWSFGRFHAMALCAFHFLDGSIDISILLCFMCCFHQAPYSRNDMLYMLFTVLSSQKNAGVS